MAGVEFFCEEVVIFEDEVMFILGGGMDHVGSNW